MREPLPFQPYWTAFRGGVKSEGKGLLPGAKDTVEKFTVHYNEFKITVQPKKGEILLDKQLQSAGPSGSLVWKRRMQFQMHTHDHNSKGMASCLYYIVGIQRGDHLEGYRLYESGQLTRAN